VIGVKQNIGTIENSSCNFPNTKFSEEDKLSGGVQVEGITHDEVDSDFDRPRTSIYEVSKRDNAKMKIT
jgi:hypothetical protein